MFLLAIVVTVSLVVVARTARSRRSRTQDLGAVSTQWLAEHLQHGAR